MVKLFCAVAGVAGSVFPVNIDAGQSVGDLKKTTKKEINYSDPAYELKLFLAKKDGAWLTEKEVQTGAFGITGLVVLNVVRAKLRRVGLSDSDVGGVDEKEAAEEGKGPVNVLVVVPNDPTTVELKQQNKDDGSSAHNGTYLSFWGDLLSLLWPLEKLQSTKKDV
ncbi:hypothetical protein PF005_g19373 [Phytophthora fragariae]|uniref:Crinkler effector protein N-terminal domain-containing protein n=1 Tax=Phytophthora fragariae TaxID=53985 RepID=A0A6A3Q5D7_9STRA|nr:hypothetical protein PF009_g25279 [Phytophthora fragariae]KAE8966006.1 hypothetical protein PF011_g28091 [Phytophthora fragariae]KAE9057288.1 hypothetical protein PF010_g31439 [Phytophthora fragariae]KAE9069025.1 hypothetical protein PF007_g27475 [Phytophthora fragariae]KAE9119096.1 hypothetical protein PF006_g18429 [Phytophthora fragariae]